MGILPMIHTGETPVPRLTQVLLEALRGTILSLQRDPARDYGYSGWVPLDDRRVLWLYCLRGEHPTPETRACHLSQAAFYDPS